MKPEQKSPTVENSRNNKRKPIDSSENTLVRKVDFWYGENEDRKCKSEEIDASVKRVSLNE